MSARARLPLTWSVASRLSQQGLLDSRDEEQEKEKSGEGQEQAERNGDIANMENESKV